MDMTNLAIIHKPYDPAKVKMKCFRTRLGIPTWALKNVIHKRTQPIYLHTNFEENKQFVYNHGL